MERPVTHTVTPENGPRPAGKPTECFYCQRPLGEPHRLDCVCRKRTVVMRYSFDVTIEVPSDWDTEQIEFHRNESSWCADNALRDLEVGAPDGCWCHRFTAVYLREANEADDNLTDAELLR